jgi:hypothetical protein
MSETIRRDEKGHIDYAHYKAKARELRTDAIRAAGRGAIGWCRRATKGVRQRLAAPPCVAGIDKLTGPARAPWPRL